MAVMSRAVMIDWQLSSYFGWGIYGINLMLNWIAQQPHPLLTTIPVRQADLQISPVEWARIQPGFEPAWDWKQRMLPFQGQRVLLDLPVLHAVGNDIVVAGILEHGIELGGSPSLGVIFFESTRFTAAGRERARHFPLIVTGSSWNQAVLEEEGISPAAFVIQGVDLTRFHPAPRAGWFAGRFTVFSGGKLEYRKGQDLVLKAFRIFAARHPDALLVTAWASPWPLMAKDFDTDASLAPVPFQPGGRVDITAWAIANGIPAHQFIDLGPIPNSEMPRIYREMDVALFPNRAEGGTNLVAMECMACAVPVVLSAHTGHLDLIRDVQPDHCFPLTRQSPIAGEQHRGWGESDIEEIVETLETVRNDPAFARTRAGNGAAFMRDLTWAATAKKMADAIAPYTN